MAENIVYILLFLLMFFFIFILIGIKAFAICGAFGAIFNSLFLVGKFCLINIKYFIVIGGKFISKDK